MANEATPFDELLSFVVDNRGRTCPTADDGFPLIATNCISNNLLFPTKDNVRYVDDKTYAQWFRAHPQPGDIIFVLKGAPGRCCLVPDPVDFCIAQDMVAVRADRNKIDPRYLFAALRSPLVQESIERMHVGTMIPHFKKGDFHQLLIPTPDRATQQFIGEVYMALVERIEGNRRMNQTLETMGRAIFMDWFVNFGPTRAKLAGHAPYLSSDLWARFPSQLSQDGWPEGWTMKPLAELTSKIGSGATPTGGNQVYVASGTALIRSQNVYDHEFIWNGLARINDSDAYKLRGVTVAEDDILINITGDSILRCSIVDPAVLPARVNQHVAIVRTRPNVPSRFVHQFLAMSRTKEILLGFDAGGSRSAVTKAHLEALPVLFPGEQIFAAFEDVAAPLFDRVAACNVENRALADLRDLLLPKLLSGEIRMKEAYTVVGETT